MIADPLGGHGLPHPASFTGRLGAIMPGILGTRYGRPRAADPAAQAPNKGRAQYNAEIRSCTQPANPAHCRSGEILGFAEEWFRSTGG